MQCCPLTCSWFVTPACAPTNGVQQLVHSAHSVFTTSKGRRKSQLCSKWNSKEPFSDNFLAIGGFFECNMCCIIVLVCLKKERKKMNNFEFWLLLFCHFQKLLHIIITTADWVRLYKLSCVILMLVCSSAIILPCKMLIHRFKLPSCFGPSLGMSYATVPWLIHEQRSQIIWFFVLK